MKLPILYTILRTHILCHRTKVETSAVRRATSNYISSTYTLFYTRIYNFKYENIFTVVRLRYILVFFPLSTMIIIIIMIILHE